MKKLGSILFPTDFSRCADQALAMALDLARANEAALHLLHALVLHRYDPDAATAQMLEQEEEIVSGWTEIAAAQLSAATFGAAEDDLELHTATRRGVSAADVILGYSAEESCDLIVMGTHGRRGAKQLLLGSVAEQVVRHADCPVLTVRETDRPRLLADCQRILVPVDFSEHSRRAVSHAKQLAAALGARLQLLHVIEQIVHPAFYVTGKTSMLQIDKELAGRCQDNLKSMLDEAPGPAVEADFELREGRATTEINVFAAEQDSDLIVIATHGLSGLQHFLIGSVTQKVVRRAPCPVLTVKSFGRSFLDRFGCAFENVSGPPPASGPDMRHFLQIPRNWLPPHCPNPKCKCHNTFSYRSDFKKTGFYTSLANPRRIQRFTCKRCGRSFSRQTFSTTYWQKRPDIDRLMFMKAIGCMANRQIGRDLAVAPETVNRHVGRIGRHCLLFHWLMIQESETTDEIVVDGFESFEYSQYYPFHHQVAVEKSTSFFSYFTDSELRRKGRMTKEQKRRRAELEKQLGRPDPKAIEKDMAEVLQVVLKDRPAATVYSDEHPAYPRSLRRVPCQVDHQRTNSKEHRNAQNPLFEVNSLDLLIRHSSSNHKRETIAWSKRRQCSAERLAILVVWRNYVKLRWEKRCRTTPAMEKGLLKKPLLVDEVLSERIFRTRVDLPPRWADYYDKRVGTRALKRNRTHDLSYAY